MIRRCSLMREVVAVPGYAPDRFPDDLEVTLHGLAEEPVEPVIREILPPAASTTNEAQRPAEDDEGRPEHHQQRQGLERHSAHRQHNPALYTQAGGFVRRRG